jgi:exo-beta-1,3-glucanase (GH17 family)
MLIDSLLPYTEGIRTFGTTDGLERIPYIAKQKNLKVIAGIWLDSNTVYRK